MPLFFIPIRRGGSASHFLVDAKSVTEAESLLRSLDEYLFQENFSGNVCHSFVLEEDWVKCYTKKPEQRLAEKILPCKHRFRNKTLDECFDLEMQKPIEWSCGKIIEVFDKRCVIHQSHYKCDLPSDCPYLIQDSIYINFSDEDVDEHRQNVNY